MGIVNTQSHHHSQRYIYVRSSLRPRLNNHNDFIDIVQFIVGGHRSLQKGIDFYQSVNHKLLLTPAESLPSHTRPTQYQLADDCRLVADARERRLRSTASRTCVVTRTYSIFGDRAFSAAGSGLWNSLPSHLKDADLSYNEFRRSLKTFLFVQWGQGAVWTLLTAPTRNIRTYLLTYLHFPRINSLTPTVAIWVQL